jgi:hypothetical protein
MKERIPSDSEVVLYPSSKKFFEVFRHQFPKQIERARSEKDGAKTQELEGQEKENEMIIHSLEKGNVEPAKRKIVSMIGENLDFVRLGVPGDLGGETHGERIGRLANFLTELENTPLEHATIRAETRPRNRTEGGAIAEVDRSSPSVEELEHSINLLETTEEQLRGSLSEIVTQKRKLADLARQVRLSTLRSDILGDKTSPMG